MKDLNYKNPESIINYYEKSTNNDMKKYLERSSIVDLITKYELYYHISLGNYVFETLLDIDETTQKIQELNLYVSPEMVLFNIYKLIEEKITEKDFEKNLEKHIREKAALQALNDFVNTDKDLIGAKYYEKSKKDIILNDKFFNETMRINFETNYQKTYEHYNMLLTDKFVKEVQSRIFN